MLRARQARRGGVPAVLPSAGWAAASGAGVLSPSGGGSSSSPFTDRFPFGNAPIMHRPIRQRLRQVPSQTMRASRAPA